MKFRILFLALLSILNPLVPSATHAQQAPGMPVVRSIEVQFVGPQTVSKEKILANMRTRVGRPYSPQVTEEDVRNLYATGNVTNVRMFGEPQGDGVKVIVVVATKSTVSEVVILGSTRVKSAKLRDQISTKPGDALSESALEADRQKIIEYYQGKGYGDVDVRYRTQGDEKRGTVRAIFDVMEGSRAKIDNVTFTGNSAVKRSELMKVIKTKPKGLMNVFSSTAGKLNSDQVQDDVRAIKELYQSKGYIQAEVRPPSVTRRGVKVDVTFPIVEGARFTVGKVTYAGARVFTLDELTRGLKLKTGAVYSPQSLAADRKTIGDLYGAKGFLDAAIIPTPLPGGPGVVDVNIRIDEGVQYYVDKVNIAGNTRTKDKVIRRELALAPGDVFNTVRMDASRQRLENLRYFSKTDVRPAEPLISVPGRRDLNVDVTEQRTGSFNFGAGFSSIDNLLGFVELTQGNFDVAGWPRLTGAGQKFRTRIQYGTQRKDFVIGLTEPYFLDQRLSIGTEGYYRDASFTSNVYDERRYGGAIFLRKPLNEFTAARFEYRLEETTLRNFSPFASPTIRAEQGSRTKSQVSAGITYDSRDRVYLPRMGMRIDAQAYLAGGFLGGETDIYGINVEASKYIALPWDTILTLEGQIAGVTTWTGGDRVPLFDRLYLGGPNDLRGFRFRDVGPKDQFGEPIGGQSLARFTAEYTFPIIEMARGAIFYDMGFVNPGAWSFGTDNLNSNYGIGLLLEIPAIGPIRIDYGIPLQSDQFNDSSGRFQFNVGYKF
ncbi:MAG: outer membrane protein assembly factor BamA [Chthoniobacteraceae bacterium]